MRRTTPLPFLVAASLAWLVLAGPGACRGQQFEVSANRPAAIYKVGDVVHWTVQWEGGGTPPHAQYVLKSGGLKEVGRGEVRLEGGVEVL